MSSSTRKLSIIALLCLTLGSILAALSVHAPQQQPLQPTLPQPAQVEIKLPGLDPLQFGYTPAPQETSKFVASLPRPTLAQAGPELLRKARTDQPVFLYRAIYEAFAAKHGKQWHCSYQGIGDCVSHGWGQGADVHLAVLWKLGHSAEWESAATEAIYGGSRVEARGVSRGGWGDGSYGSAAAKWVRDWGIVFRRDYPTCNVDLSVYDSSRAKQWGNYGCGGAADDGKLDTIAKSHPIRSVTLVRSFDEAAAAIQSGYPVPVCSGRGFSSKRDSQGFARPSGSWSHCMVFIGVRFGDRPGLLCLNSWGTEWIDGPKWPDDQPDGSFWVDASVATAMLDDGDSFAISGYDGFPWQDLRHDDWVSTDPAKVRALERRRYVDQTTGEPEYALAP